MKYFDVKICKYIASLALVVVLISGTSVKVNAAPSGSITINTTYGNLTGQVRASIFVDAKNINTTAKTTKKVPRLMTNVDIHYYKTGNLICRDGIGWEKDVKYLSTDVDMGHFKNALNNNKCDGFLNTKLTAYGCAEAIVKKAYTVYTSCTY